MKKCIPAAFAIATMLSSTALADSPHVNTRTNFAFGGARSDAMNATAIFAPELAGAVGAAGLELWGLPQQFAAANESLDLPVKRNNKSLFYLSVGTNDFLSGLLLGNLDPAATAARIGDALETMHGMGARTIVVPNLLPVGDLPFWTNLAPVPPEVRALLNNLTAYFNYALLPGVVAQFEAAHAADGVHVVVLDVAGIYASLPATFNRTQTCERAGALPACDGYFFVDDVHPTSAVYAAYADAAFAALDALAEDDEDENRRFFHRVITFGDSLADTGSFNDVVLRSTGAPFSPVFYQGRFSNGPNVIDFLEDENHLNVLYPSQFYQQ